jgi:formylglycine-generating enzyme required for sulfatase activity
MIDATAVKGQSAESLRAIQKAWAEHLDLPPVLSVSLDQHVKMEFVLIPPGKFVMGSSASDAIQAMRSDSKMEAKQLEREQPAHQVTISQPFYLGRFEVTRAEFAALHGKMPLRGKPRLPMNRLTWDEAKEFCDELSHTHLPHGVRLATLPTEAQWEFACRGGTRTAFHFGDSLSGVEANCNGSIAFGSRVKGLNREELLEVGSFAPNALGLYDMHGNVAEWCLDGWSEFAYRAEGRTDPVVPASENQHVFRGGSWDDFARSCRSAHRNWTDANNKTDYVGFRVVLIISDPAEH